MDKHKKINPLCVQFSTTNFLHLTGVKFQAGKELSSGSFFDKCLKRRLSVDEFEMAVDGTTERKLQILPLLFSKNLSATMVGDFSARTPLLVTVKIVTYRKSKSDDRYSEIVYATKKIDWNKVKFPDEYNYLPKPNG